MKNYREFSSIYLCVRAVDFRKEIYGLVNLIKYEINDKPFSGSLFSKSSNLQTLPSKPQCVKVRRFTPNHLKYKNNIMLLERDLELLVSLYG
ncbi:IS66 family insertion sequence element accessory protein TnpB [Pigmentibacter ruber]|uniref:IS66 family insertion sequence element accessory protein TnpB n=1 Tax=Pigmentibacter ruber TaxID=2683196 RepID=UPI00131E8725|nr:IS66 family insertion sequence element accessory protein TnpB [Pigmentibacter ruber]